MTEINIPRQHEKYERLIAAANALPPLTTAVAYPCDETSLKGALEAAEAGLIKPILVGPEEKIRGVAHAFSLNLPSIEVIDVPHSQAAAEKAVTLVRSGKAELLMKGSLHTDELLAAVVNRETGIRTGRRISHVFVMDVPGHPHTLFITDAAVNIAPDLTAKHDIIQNAIDLHVGLGLGTPKVAILSAVETITLSIPSTIEAAALCKMADRGQITGGELDLEAGNMLAKNLIFLSGADAAGVVLGARVPIILTSRADNLRTRMASCAVAMLLRQSQITKQPIQV
jgi:phosphate acetyltransferase